MSKRLTIYVSDDTPEKLLALAGGQRKQGEFISNLVSAAWENQQVSNHATVEGVRFQVMGVIAELQELKGRIAMVEGRVQ